MTYLTIVYLLCKQAIKVNFESFSIDSIAKTIFNVTSSRRNYLMKHKRKFLYANENV